MRPCMTCWVASDNVTRSNYCVARARRSRTRATQKRPFHPAVEGQTEKLFAMTIDRYRMIETPA
jgi:hypothetical protein